MINCLFNEAMYNEIPSFCYMVALFTEVTMQKTIKAMIENTFNLESLSGFCFNHKHVYLLTKLPVINSSENVPSIQDLFDNGTINGSQWIV